MAQWWTRRNSRGALLAGEWHDMREAHRAVSARWRTTLQCASSDSAAPAPVRRAPTTQTRRLDTLQVAKGSARMIAAQRAAPPTARHSCCAVNGCPALPATRAPEQSRPALWIPCQACYVRTQACGERACWCCKMLPTCGRVPWRWPEDTTVFYKPLQYVAGLNCTVRICCCTHLEGYSQQGVDTTA